MPDFGLSRAIRQAVNRGAREAKVLRPGQEAQEVRDRSAVGVSSPDGTLPPEQIARPALDEAVSELPVAPASPDVVAPTVDPAATIPPVVAKPIAQPPSALDVLPPAPPVADVAAEAVRVTSRNLGDYDLEATSQINFDKITTTDEIKAVIADVGARNAGRIDEARRNVITNEQLKGLAADLSVNETFLRSVIDRPTGGAFNAESILASRQVLNASATRIYDLGLKVKAGQATDIEKLQFRRQMMWHFDFQTQLMGARAEAGRALNAFNIPTDGREIDFSVMRDTVENMYGYDTERLANMVVMTEGNPAAIAKATRQYNQSTVMGMVNELFINSILSGPTTHIVNTAGSILFQTMNVAETAVAARMGRFLSGEEHVAVGEASALLHGTIGAYKDAFAIAARTMRTGVPLDDVVKFDGGSRRSISSSRALTPEQMSTPVGGFAASFIDVVGEAIRVPTERVMAPTDEFFKTLAYRAELQRLAMRHVQERNPGSVDEAAEMAREFMENAPLDAQKASDDYTRYVTFQNPLGEVGQKFQLAIRAAPPLTLIAPFIRTPINIFKAGILDRSPLGLFRKKFWSTMRAGGRERDMMLARVTMGSATSAVVASYVMDGTITGGGPQDPAQREILQAAGWRPYSVRVTNPTTGKAEYRSYARAEPLAFVIGATADVVEIMSYLNSDAEQSREENEYLTHAAAAIVTGIANNTTSKTFVKGVVDFTELLGDPTRYIDGWTRNTSQAFIPYSSLRNELGQIQDPYLREAWTVIDQIKIRSGIPGYSEGAPPRRDIFGKPRMTGVGSLLGTMSPFPVSVDESDLVMREVMRVMETTHTVPISMPGKRIDGLRLSAEEYDDLVRISRLEPAPNGLTFKDAIGVLTGASAYLRATPDSQSDLIRKVQTTYDDMARARLSEENPLFAVRLLEHRERQRRLKRGF